MKKRVLAILLVCAMLAAALASCGGSDTPDTPDSPNTPSTPSTPSTPNTPDTPDTPTASGPREVTLGSAMAWENLTPFRTMRVWAITYSRMIYDPLAYFSPDGELLPVAAKSWEVEDDGVTWNVEIYDYITDSAGNHITADDIVWFIQESKARGLKPIFNQVKSVEKTGEYTFKIVLEQDMAGNFDMLLLMTFVISKSAFEADPDEFNNSVVSTGPYLVTNFVSGNTIVLEKRADYWQKEELIPDCMKNNVDKLTINYISEASQQQIALETHQVDGYIAMTQSLLADLGDDFKVANVPSMSGTILRFSGDGSRAISSDENLRKAIAYAIDENGLIQGVYAGYAAKMCGPESSGSVGFQQEWKDQDNYSYNVEKAKEYLAKSNYDGEELTLYASSSAANDRLCAMIQSYLGEIGVKVKLEIVERSLYTASSQDGSQWDMIIFNVGAPNLATMWSQSYDPAAYPNGDAAGRNDSALTELVYKAWTNAGFTKENINAVHEYLMEHLYDYGICQPYQCDVYRADLGITQESYLYGGALDFVSCVYGG